MIGLFPTPYPDELWYSLCARYAAIVQYPRKTRVIKELFGKEGLKVGIDLPSSLNNLTSNLPCGSKFTNEKIIHEHTLLSFYAPFLPRERVSQLIKMMTRTTGASIHKVAGITASTVCNWDKLRFCPVCAEEDRENYGILYWHRLPQLPGIDVCPKHSVFFENSTGQIKNPIYKADLFTAEQHIPDISVRHIDIDDEIHRLLLQLAKDAEWLLSQKNLCVGYEFLNNSYTNTLGEKGYLQQSGNINLKLLNNRIRNTYPRNFLQIVQSDYDENKGYNWVARIIPHLKHGRVHHPLRHLLVIRALGETPQSFLKKVPSSPTLQKLPLNDSYFIRGPYPCFNVVCQNYLQKTISNYQIRKSCRSSTQTIFVNCECGFSYYRSGPDKVPEDLFSKDFITNFGELWEQALEKMWKDLTLSVRQIAKSLHASHNVIKNRAMALGLKFPRKGPGPKIMNLLPKKQKTLQKNKFKRDNSVQLFNTQRDENRRIWLNAVKNNPDATRSKLRIAIEPKAGSWLMKYDREWLETNQPKRWQRTESARQIDWKNRDEQLVVQIHAIAEEIKEKSGKPIKVTPNEISRALGKAEWLTNSKYKKKLPLSQTALAEVVETILAYNLRLIDWAIGEIKEKGGSCAFYSIARKASVSWNNWQTPEIKSAIEQGQREIEEDKMIW